MAVKAKTVTGAGIGWSYVDGEFVSPEPPPLESGEDP